MNKEEDPTTTLPTGLNEPAGEESSNVLTSTAFPQTTKIGRLKRRKLSKRRKKKLLRPNSPAAYPSALPIRNEYYEQEQTQTSGLSSNEKDDDDHIAVKKENIESNKIDNSVSAFQSFRIHYLIIHIAIMLADGLQGTHLYVLYEGYGYTVASLYSLGFLSGALTSPFTGPLVDKIGRRNSAVAYCVLEIAINLLEQYDNIYGLIFSRVVGGITTNLLFTVFESWLVTEHRKRGFSEDKLETILRDSVVASNLSAIASGCIAHYCALLYGPTGPFSGAVTCTFVALILVATRWEENYGSDNADLKGITCYMKEAFNTIISDSKIYRIGLIQGLTEGALQTFVFLWSPALRHFANQIPASKLAEGVLGIDASGEPAYGLIFGAFMACGAIGGLMEPPVRRAFSVLIKDSDTSKKELEGDVFCKKDVADENSVLSETSELSTDDYPQDMPKPSTLSNRTLSMVKETDSDSEEDSVSEQEEEKPMAVELLASFCFLVSAALLSTPVLIDDSNPYAFTFSLLSFLTYELIVGLYMPCEGVLRSIYMPNDSICSLMTMLRVIVNVAVALGVISSNYIPFTTAFGFCSLALIVATLLQLSLVEANEWRMLSKTLHNFFTFNKSSGKSTIATAASTQVITQERKTQ